MDVLKRFAEAGVVPAVVLEEAANAVPAAKALLDGGIDVMEITFRTEAAAESIRKVSENCPQMLVGAGTVITLEQCERAVAAGARFIVCPGFDKEIVRWCQEHEVCVVPGCAVPSELSAAVQMGLRVVKFFPAGVYGGLAGMKALSGPYAQVRFMPTGGINADNLADYMEAPFVHAVGGSWVCSKKDIADGNFERITELCKQARERALGYEIAHIGINCADTETAQNVVEMFGKAFGFAGKEGNTSFFAGNAIEVMKNGSLGVCGHLAVRTNRMDMALADLEQKGFEVALDTAKYKNGRMIAVYLKESFGGFAVHLLQK